MLTDKELEELVQDLHSPDISLRVAALKDLWRYPTRDVRVLPYLEALLNDNTLCVVMLPYQYGEICWLAANALAVERKALNIQEPIRLMGVVRPLDTQEFAAACVAAGVDTKGGLPGVLNTLAILRNMGKLPLYDLELKFNAFALAPTSSP